MLISDSLHDLVHAGSAVERVVLLGPDRKGSHLSAVIVRIPPRHEFALHTHPASEDCFFVLAGSGEVFEPGAAALPIAAPAGVWIPAGAPHGLRAGGDGMLEIGFQAPPDPTAVPFGPDAVREDDAVSGLRTESIPIRSDATGDDEPWWTPTFPDRGEFRFLDVHHSVLSASQELPVAAGGGELVVVVASGAVAVTGSPAERRVEPVAIIHLSGADEVTLRALETPTLLHAVRALAADPSPSA
jgi:quercetin dioxygenase-like cupin family protein